MKARTRLWLRVILALLFATGLAVTARHVRLFYADVAPFHQMYYSATPAQDAAVTERLIMTHFITPGLALGLVLVLLPSFVYGNPRRLTRILSLMFLLAGLQGCTTCARLPYGFGSGYEHANEVQHYHLELSRWTITLSLGISVLLLFAGTLCPPVSWRQRQDVEQRETNTKSGEQIQGTQR